MDFLALLIVLGCTWLLLDMTVGRRLRDRRQRMDDQKMRARAIDRDITDYERRMLEEPIDGKVIRHLRGRF